MRRKVVARLDRGVFTSLIRPLTDVAFHKLLIADGITIEYQTFNAYLNNKKIWKLADAMVICRRLDVPIETLFQLCTNERGDKLFTPTPFKSSLNYTIVCLLP